MQHPSVASRAQLNPLLRGTLQPLQKRAGRLHGNSSRRSLAPRASADDDEESVQMVRTSSGSSSMVAGLSAGNPRFLMDKGVRSSREVNSDGAVSVTIKV